MSNTDDTREFLESVAAEGCSRIELLRFVDRSRVREILWPSSGAGTDAEFIAKRAAEIVRMAERDGLQRQSKEVPYAVVAYRTEAMGGHEFAEHPIRVPGAAAAKGGSIEEEMPTSANGIIALLLRRDENMHKLVLSQTEGNRAALERQVAQLSTQVDMLQLRHVALIKLTEDLASAQIERDILKRSSEREDRNQKWVIEQLEVYAPIIANRYLGGGPGTGKAPMGEQMIKMLLGKLGPRLTAAMESGGAVKFSAEELVLLAELYTSVGEAEKEKEERKDRALNGKTATGVDDVAAAAAAAKNGVGKASGDGKEDKPS